MMETARLTDLAIVCVVLFSDQKKGGSRMYGDFYYQRVFEEVGDCISLPVIFMEVLQSQRTTCSNAMAQE